MLRFPGRPLLLSATALALLTTPTRAAAPPFDTTAPIAFMKDLSSDAVLYAKDADRRIPPASMAKMMTVYVAFDLIRRGELKLDQMITVRPETWQRWHGPAAGSTMFLSPGQQVSVENLLHGIVTLSGNDACVVLAEGISGTEPAFVALMNQAAERLGMRNSRFGNSNGWPDEGRTYTTARDLTTLAEATIERFPELYRNFYSRREFTWGQTMGGQAITQGNRDPLIESNYQGGDGLKTGHTAEAGYGFTGSAVRDNRRLVMVVAGLDSYGGRRQESIRFMDWGFGAWRARPLLARGAKVDEAAVQMGDADVVGLVAPRDLSVTIPAGMGQDMRVSVVYNGPIKAPIAKGQHVADLVVQTAGMPAQSLPLVAENAVGEAGFFRRVWNGLTSFFG
ncbi:D-alanyl-D-alanine carboxypeptidase (penicillin-binding protein 5/6) [Sphingomonas jejuensis]|uniref:serine-type D-Ala-D-Ala carboxypeptidase n=1 Tax=Sphingomonas jejuensis TaxID=904715 RepID=A0ABX0XL95_9SPHN|nr:D-alanyl-D-alanine carboxypeptidase family protein [Sphingomonas jejuensis]NJC33500.1 D-alanyl-D-alanine carboxypeptidase (penicillin-binding protein 5/6) [Sphingomonas jejuensis]